jgi:hypothetical protein
LKSLNEERGIGGIFLEELKMNLRRKKLRAEGKIVETRESLETQTPLFCFLLLLKNNGVIFIMCS